MGIIDLPDEMLVNILERMDVMTRVRCESVCTKFHSIASSMYNTHAWKDFPNDRTGKLVISAGCVFSDMIVPCDTIEVQEDEIRVRVLKRECLKQLKDPNPNEQERAREQHIVFVCDSLASILAKFASHVRLVELHNVGMNSTAVSALIHFRNRIRSLKCFQCRLSGASASIMVQFRSNYGTDLMIRRRCNCGLIRPRCVLDTWEL